MMRSLPETLRRLTTRQHMSDWWAELAKGWWARDMHLRPSEDVHAWLQSKHDVARRLEPGLVGEFGVRAGYSAFAMLSAAPDATYVGVDIHDVAYGYEQGSMEHARKLLAPFRCVFFGCDTHSLNLVPRFDLLHIDGDHSLAGCVQDLQLALQSGVRWALVDDYDEGDIVRRAVDTFAEDHGINIEHIDDGFRGSALMDLTEAGWQSG